MWLCGTHGILIDTNRGDKFPAPHLLNWKRLQEARISQEQGGVKSDFRWLHEIRLHNNFIFKPDTRLTIGKATLLWGDNGTGKTAICDWLAATNQARVLDKWSDEIAARGPLRYTVILYDPLEHAIKVCCDKKSISYTEDGNYKPIVTLPFKIISINLLSGHLLSEIGDLEYVARSLRTDVADLKNFISLLGRELSHSVSNVRIVTAENPDENGEEIQADVEGTSSGLFLRMLSWSELARVVIELGMAMAQFYSLLRPTLLILDFGRYSFDDKWIERYARFLLSDEIKFQCLIEFADKRGVDWAGWTLAEFRGEPPDVILS